MGQDAGAELEKCYFRDYCLTLGGKEADLYFYQHGCFSLTFPTPL